MFESRSASALVVGLARNCAEALVASRPRIEALSESFSRTDFCFVTNDSTDNTAAYLHAWARDRSDIEILDLTGLADRVSIRSARIAAARNAYLDLLEDRARTGTRYDLLVVVDLDGVDANLIAEPLFADVLRRAPADWAAVFANQRTYYYDIWALRHPYWCPDDCWSAVEAARRRRFFRKRALREAERINVRERQVHIPTDEPPIEVESAFGGFGIYRTKWLSDIRYQGIDQAGRPVCEHVLFHAGIRRKGGRLWILPELLNDAPEEHLHTDLPRNRARPRPWKSP